MDILPLDVFKNRDEIRKYNAVRKIDLVNGAVVNTIFNNIRSLKDSEIKHINDRLLTVLKTFNSCISNVDIVANRYTLDNISTKNSTILSFERLSTGERLFVACIIFDALSLKLAVCEELRELDMKHIKLLFEFFNSNSNIRLIPPTIKVFTLILAVGNHLGGEVNVKYPDRMQWSR